MKLLFIAVILLFSTAGIASDYLEVLKNHCEKNQSDHWVKISEACRLVRGELKIDQLCDGYSKGQTKQTLMIDSIATDLAKIKSTSTESMVKDLCDKQIGQEALDTRPECIEERSQKQKMSRSWWDGSAWVGTQETLESVKEKAAKGDRLAQFNLGAWYMDGAKCVARDMKLGGPLLCKAYDSGEKMALLQFKKVINHPTSEKVRELFGKDYGCDLSDRQKQYASEMKKLEDQAKAHLKKAEGGSVPSMVRVGVAYLNGDINGGKEDYKSALQWFKKAADKGNPEAMGLLGAMYNRGDGIEKDNDLAFEWSLKAAQKGDLDSQYFVGLCYYNGQGTEEDLTKSVQWLNKAMDRGHNEAKQKLVEMYLKGELQSVAFKALSDRLKKLESK